MKLTKTKLRQFVKEELRGLLNEFREGDTVKHKEKNFGVGKITAISRQGATKGQVTVRWSGGVLTHRGDFLEPATEKELEEKKGKAVNPWAVCTDSVGREDKEKYERCVKKVKAKHKIKKD